MIMTCKNGCQVHLDDQPSNGSSRGLNTECLQCIPHPGEEDGDELPRLVDLSKFDTDLGYIEPNDDHLIEIFEVDAEGIIELGDLTFFKHTDGEINFHEVVYATTKFYGKAGTYLLFVQLYPITDVNRIESIVAQYADKLPHSFFGFATHKN